MDNVKLAARIYATAAINTIKNRDNEEIALAIVDNIKNNLDSDVKLENLSHDQMLFMLQVIKTLVNFKR